MKFWFRLSNWNLAATLALGGLLAGCATGSKEDQLSTIRIHLEVNPLMERHNMTATVLRAHPIDLIVAEEPLVHEGFLDEAGIVTSGDTFSLRLKFDDTGSRLLANYTAINLGKRMAVMAQFPESRWLAAPVISGRITNGVVMFTPDADLAETRRLIDGLNLVIHDRKKHSLLK